MALLSTLYFLRGLGLRHCLPQGLNIWHCLPQELTSDVICCCTPVPCRDLDVGRDYYQFQAVKQGNKIFLVHGPKGPAGTRDWPGTTESFRRWCTGTTGWPLVDANMRELKVRARHTCTPVSSASPRPTHTPFSNHSCDVGRLHGRSER